MKVSFITCPECGKEIDKTKILSNFTEAELEDYLNYLEVKNDLQFEKISDEIAELNATSKEYENEL